MINIFVIDCLVVIMICNRYFYRNAKRLVFGSLRRLSRSCAKSAGIISTVIKKIIFFILVLAVPLSASSNQCTNESVFNEEKINLTNFIKNGDLNKLYLVRIMDTYLPLPIRYVPNNNPEGYFLIGRPYNLLAFKFHQCPAHQIPSGSIQTGKLESCKLCKLKTDNLELIKSESKESYNYHVFAYSALRITVIYNSEEYVAIWDNNLLIGETWWKLVTQDS